MRLFIEHETRYSFSQPQKRLVQLLRVTPSSFLGQNVIDWRIDVDCDTRLKSGRDGYGNETTMLYVDGPIERIHISVRGEVLTDDRAGMVDGATEPLPPLIFTRATPLTAPTPGIRAFAAEIERAATNRLNLVHRLNTALNERIAFDAGAMDVKRTAGDAFAAGEGVCQDHAHIFIAAARAAGIPARYVSGHLFRPGDDRIQAATHAWAEAWVEGYGWIGFDAVNDHCPDDGYVRVAVGLDYHDAAPLSGARIGGGDEWLRVGVRVGLAPMQAAQAADRKQD